MDAVYEWLGTADGGLLLWGLTLRGIAIIYCFHFYSLSRQIEAWAGAEGITPVNF
jgi:hypothetical protein